MLFIRTIYSSYIYTRVLCLSHSNIDIAHSIYYICSSGSMSSKLQLDVRHHIQWWHHLLNTYEGKAGMV